MGTPLDYLDPSPAFETYWRFAAARQEVYMQRVHGEPFPWTCDPILSRYRFTNAYRAADRVSQFLIRDVILPSQESPEDLTLRILLFKIFNKIETWHLLDGAGEISCASFSFARSAEVLDDAWSRGRRIYSGAYIMPPVRSSSTTRKHHGHLKLIESMMDDGIVDRLVASEDLRAVYDILLEYPGIGPFLAYQLAIDLNYSTITDHDEMGFVVAGPGALDGISKCFPGIPASRAEGVIRDVCEAQEESFRHHRIDFKTLWGRRLQLIDCQNLFCEISKYTRVSHPEIQGRSGRTRIKQNFRPAGAIPTPVFPPKWGLSLPGDLRRRELDGPGFGIGDHNSAAMFPDASPDLEALQNGMLPLGV